jgi:asparagine synthetase B (glutamine-hydrolysing)
MWKNKELLDFYRHEFDFRQYKTDYEDWLKAFEKSVERRKEGKLFIGMSSGYDSGALTKELLKQNADFKAYIMYNHENKSIINERLKYLPNHEIASMSKELWNQYYDFLKDKINPLAMRDKASMGVAYTFETAAKEGRTICISGQGGDEIISDYAKFPNQNTFKGKFPERLFEWLNFRSGMQFEYLNEIEDIAALYGIEVRYPFLDVDLVQEYLWLSADLKNKNYKAPLFEYLTRNQVPFEEGIKRGFQPIRK